MAKKPHPRTRRRAPAVTPRDAPIAPAVQSTDARPPTAEGLPAPRWALAGLALLVAGSVGARIGRDERPSPVAAPREEAAAAGRTPSPYPGLIARHEVWLRPPEDHIRPEDCDALQAAWGAPDRARFDAAMTRGGLDATTRAAVLDLARCDDSGCVAAPPDPVLAGLSTAQRVGVFRAMREYPQAMSHFGPFVRPVGRRAFWDDPGVSPAAREVLRAGSFVDREQRYFTDLTWLCHRVTDAAGRQGFFRALRARSALDATVRVRSTGELERAVAWWGARGREDIVRARLLASMRDGDAGVPLRELLPPFARARYGTFPPRDTRFNCFWTALNFFSPTGEGGPPVDSDVFDATTASWTQVPIDQLRFGDVLAFRTGAGVSVHAAVYLADDLVFTKDGWSMHRAWEVVTIARERRAYDNAPQVAAYRPP